MGKIELSKYVSEILETMPATRTNDGILWFTIIDRYTDFKIIMQQSAAPWESLRIQLERKTLPTFESVSRARRNWMMKQKETKC